MNIAKIDDITERTVEGLLNGTINPNQAKAISAVLHQNISAVRLALEYAKLKGPGSTVPMLEQGQRRNTSQVTPKLREAIAAIQAPTFTIFDLDGIIESNGFRRITVTTRLIDWAEEGILKKLPKPEGQRENIYARGEKFNELFNEE